MQFFYLFSFVVVASYAAALPQPAELSAKYSNNTDTNLASASTIEEAGEDYVKVPESVKTAAATVGGSVEKELVEYLKKAIYVGEQLKEWDEGAGKNTVLVIQSGLGDEEYAKVEPSLKEAGEKLTTDASDNLQKITAAVSAIGEKAGPVKPEMETIHAAVGRTLDAYKAYFEVLQPQLTKFDAGANINQYLSEASASFVGFSSSQQGLYDGILQGLETAPSE
ncbi:hypothetical protein BASA60_006828 [Batrachochytrium salamandrivorans]|nr:hypothetical protein BASA60_006828 [Batrachochytrium salamandrivorans]